MLKLGTERWSYSSKVVQQTQSEADHWNHVAGPQSPHSEIPHSNLWGFMGILFDGIKLSLRKYKNWEHIIIKLKYSIHLWCCDSNLTCLKQTQHSPLKEEAKHSRSPARRKLPWWKMKVKKTQHRGSDKRPSMLENWHSKRQTQQKAHAAQFQIPEDLWFAD